MPFCIEAYTTGYQIYRRSKGFALFIERDKKLVGPIMSVEDCKNLAERDALAEEEGRKREEEYYSKNKHLEK